VEGGKTMSGNKVVKSVSFNVTNERDLSLLERIENVQFAPYIKRLIEKDIKSRIVIKSDPQPVRTGGNTTPGLIITRGTTLSFKAE
jgi:hypothetical protein